MENGAEAKDEDTIGTLIGPGQSDPGWVRFVRWIVLEAEPEDWHRVMIDWNWDNDTLIPAWISRSPRCDRATALQVFWWGQPEDTLERTGDRSREAGNDMEFLDDIRARWRAGFYRRSEFAFDFDHPWRPPRNLAALDAEHGARALEELPPDMRVSLPGRVLDTAGYLDGLPPRFQD